MSKVFEIESTPVVKPHDGTTSIYIVLDETGSMSSVAGVTISSFNEYIQTQKNGDEECRVSLVTFSSTGYGTTRFFRSGIDLNTKMDEARNTGDHIRKIFIEESLHSVPALTTANYKPNGGTNLYDAIGETITTIDSQLAGREAIPNILVVIFTDGEENASREYTLSTIKNMIETREKQGWTFVYMGANQDAWQVGASFGLSKGQTMTYSVDQLHRGVETLSASTQSYRSLRTAAYSKGATAMDSSAVSRDFFSSEEKKNEIQ